MLAKNVCLCRIFVLFVKTARHDDTIMKRINAAIEMMSAKKPL